MGIRMGVVAAVAAASLALPAVASAGNLVTIMFSRAQVQGVVSPGCTPVPGGVTIWQVADDLAAKGYVGTEAASTSLEVENGESCVSGNLVLGWSDLRTLQSTYGWEVVPRGNADDRTAATSAQWDDSCGLLPTFYSEGFPDAWAMYAYYGGPYSASMQSGVVNTCFSFGRTYRTNANPLPVPSPYLVSVFSINGGYCSDPSLPCHTISAPNGYTQPSTLQALVQSSGWDVIQGYKFVTGSYSSSSVSWDCTGADPSSHWSTRGEYYCYNDWQSVIDAIPATAQVVTPSQVAAMQARVMARGPLASLSLTPSSSSIVAGGSQPFRVEGYDAQGNDLGDFTAASTLTIDAPGTCSGASCGSASTGTYTVTATDGAVTGTATLRVLDPPSVTGVSPTVAPAGTTITITGTGLDQVIGVSFNGTKASFTAVSPTQLTTVVPAAATDGQISLTTAGGVPVDAGPFAVAPSITGFSPSTGAAGSTVKISGGGFAGATGVTVAGAAASFTVGSATSITATVPSYGAPGPITVTTPNGTATSTGLFGQSLSIAGFSPTSGKVGSSVTITGTGFVGVTAVVFNGGAAKFTVASPTSITAVVPLAAATGKITVKIGTTLVRSAASFTVIPVISSFAPSSGPPGTVVDIKGTGFMHASAVLFGGVAATSFSVVSGGEVKATVPAGAVTGRITVRTPGGSAKSATSFTVTVAQHR